MAAPKFAPVAPLDDARGYESPDHVPERVGWPTARPTSPAASRRARGSATRDPTRATRSTLAARSGPEIQSEAAEHVDDALAGCTAIALRRASMFGRAPVIHDLRIACTIWGFLDPAPPAELVELRRPLFEGVAHTLHHYDELRALVDSVPEATLRRTPDQVGSAYPADWRSLGR